MSDAEEVGFIVGKKCEETEIEWKIPDIFTVAESKTVIYCPIFSFANTQWRLQLDLEPTSLRRMRLYLKRIEICGVICVVEYDLGLKKTDGSIESLCKAKKRYLRGHIMLVGPFCIKLSKIEQQKSEFAPLNMLVIVCKLKRGNRASIQPKTLNALKLNTIINTNLLFKNLKDIFTNKESCDTVLLVQDKEFKVHKALLIARSPVFAAMFRHDTAEKQTGEVIINDCDPDSFQAFLEYLYSGKLEDITANIAFNLYKISDKYNVQELKRFCINYLVLNLTVQNVCEVISFAHEYDEKFMLSSAQSFFNANIKEILVTSEWENLWEKNFSLANKALIEMVDDKEKMPEVKKRKKK